MIAFIGTRLHFGLFLLAVGLGTLMAGCGFQLRGSYSLPYESIYVGGADYNLIVANMKRAIRNTGTRLADSKEDAQATFLPAGEKREAKILSLSSTGRVREKRLVYTYNYRVIDGKGRRGKNREGVLGVAAELDIAAWVKAYAAAGNTTKENQ